MNEAPPVRLHQFKEVWGRNISPFTLKLEAWLILAGIAYQVVPEMKPGRGPTGKLPFIEDQGRPIADSSLIIEHLSQTRGIDLDAALDAESRAEALALKRLLEEHLYFILAYGRWLDPEGWRSAKAGMFGSLPPGVRDVVGTAFRQRVKRDLMGQGIARHHRRDIYAMAEDDLAAVATILDDGPFFFQGRPGTLDCTAYGVLANILLVPVENELKRIATRFKTLRAFCHAMEWALDRARSGQPAHEAEPALV